MSPPPLSPPDTADPQKKNRKRGAKEVCVTVVRWVVLYAVLSLVLVLLWRVLGDLCSLFGWTSTFTSASSGVVVER